MSSTLTSLLGNYYFSLKVGVLTLLDDSENVLGLLGGIAPDVATIEALVPHMNLFHPVNLAGGSPAQGCQHLPF